MKQIMVAVLVSFLLQCSIPQKIAQKEIRNIVQSAEIAMFSDDDIQFSEKAIASNIKLIEALAMSYPNEQKYQSLLSQAYCSYAYAFLEEKDPQRAKKFYQRGIDQAAKTLGLDFTLIHPDSLSGALQKIDEDKIDLIFWCAFNWAAKIFLSMTEPAEVKNITYVKELMNWVIEKDETYYYGFAYVFWGSYYAMMPSIAGGDIEKSMQFFNKAFQISNRSFLMVHAFFMQQYCLTLMDEEIFDEIYQEVIEFDMNQLPEQRLTNEIAKNKIIKLYQNKDEFF